MSVPSELYEVKRRIDRYIWEDETLPLVRLRDILSRHFLKFESVGIVGGLVRDFARRGRDSFKSDIDLVVEAKEREVVALAAVLGAQPNRFGGFSYQHPLWKIDFWALESTWAARGGYVSVQNLRDITRCTFFDCDSSVYDINKRRVYASREYLPRLSRGVIDVNLRPNPSPNGNLLRAIRRILLWNFQPGPYLREFIEQNLTQSTMQEIASVEEKIYSNPIVSLYESRAKLLREVNYRSGRAVLDPSLGCQLELPLTSL